jgi:hypothetical protein
MRMARRQLQQSLLGSIPSDSSDGAIKILVDGLCILLHHFSVRLANPLLLSDYGIVILHDPLLLSDYGIVILRVITTDQRSTGQHYTEDRQTCADQHGSCDVGNDGGSDLRLPRTLPKKPDWRWGNPHFRGGGAVCNLDACAANSIDRASGHVRLLLVAVVNKLTPHTLELVTAWDRPPRIVAHPEKFGKYRERHTIQQWQLMLFSFGLP